jgi:hypothetical protein
MDKIQSYDKSKYTWDQWVKTPEYKKLDTEHKDLYKIKHNFKVQKAQLTFREPNGKFRPQYNKLSKITENVIKSYPDLEDGLHYYVTGSTYLTHELIKRPDMKREVLSEEEAKKFKDDNDLEGTIWHEPTHNAIARMDKLMEQSIIPEDIIVYTGISKDLWDSLPKEPGSEYKNITFISTTLDKSIAKGFAAKRKQGHNEGSGKYDTGKQKESYYLEINAKSGTKGLATEQAALRYNPLGTWIVGEGGKQHAGGSQQEIVMDRHQKYRVIGMESDGKTFKKLIVETI